MCASTDGEFRHMRGFKIASASMQQEVSRPSSFTDFYWLISEALQDRKRVACRITDVDTPIVWRIYQTTTHAAAACHSTREASAFARG